MTLLLVFLIGSSAAFQETLTEKDLAGYRLNVGEFKRFQQASGLIAEVFRSDPKRTINPLFTRDLILLEDATVAASQLEKRLTSEPRLASALRKSLISPRDYTRFALALFAARLAHGFMKSGALRKVPAGA